MNFGLHIARLVRCTFAKRSRLGVAVALAVLVPLLLWGQSSSWTFGGGTASVTGVNVGIATTNPL